ncbi:unnamed protein product [Adineta ricciae]|uniref:Uncharacterized protein n=1 Tax=Adineta ricciae TaxID=249248 RepID=A0A814TFA4_ADIRI|nr:unnamed protein product [Adineta ricciae]CAF1191572.1 unnamed protein product [Adineta ricciae]
MTIAGWLTFLSTAASYLGKLLSFGGPISIPATLAVYKFDFNTFVYLLFLALCFASDLYTILLVFQAAVSKFTEITTTIINNNKAQAAVLIGIVALTMALFYFPSFSVLAYIGYRIVALGFAIILRKT